MEMSTETQYYSHGLVHFAGGTLPNAITAYRTHGNPSNPCIVFPTYYGGRLQDQYYLVGEGKALDPRKYFIVTFALFSNGESSSPSNTPEPHNGPYFPKVSYEDNIRAQHAVLTKKFGVQKIHCAIGFSMGGQQAYHWAIMYPDLVERFICICGSARTSIHSQSFIEGLKAVIIASRDFDFGHYKYPPVQGIRAFSRVLCGWSYGQTWFREHDYLQDGKYSDLDSFVRTWEKSFLAWDANDILTLMNTWSQGNIAIVKNGGDLAKALNSIKAKGLIMPAKTDFYFPPEDNEIEVSHLPNAKLVVIDTVWGHMAGEGVNDKDTRFIQDQISEFLS